MPQGKYGLLRRFAPRNDGDGSRGHRLDIVAVGIDQERGVIRRAVVLARARCAIVAAAGLQSSSVKNSERNAVGRKNR